MSINLKGKILFIIMITLLVLVLFNVNVKAETEKFAFEVNSIEVRLNGTGYISSSGGSGDITWKSEDTSIATVENGTVTGQKVGTTNITATRGGETATCKVNVVYGGINITGNQGNILSVTLIIGEHDSENLVAHVEDGNSEEVANVPVTWTSSNSSIVTVDNTGCVKAIKQGKATITASVAGASDTCEVIVYNGPSFTDFSNAQYETAVNWTEETLQVKRNKT